MLATLFALYRSIPHSWLMIGGSIAFAFALGLATGNVWTTQRELDKAADRSAKAYAEGTRAVWEAWQDENKKLASHLAEDAVRGRSADDHVTASLAKAKDEALQQRAAALSQLAIEKSKREVPNVPPSCPQPVPFSFSPDARLRLDQASGAVSPYTESAVVVP